MMYHSSINMYHPLTSFKMEQYSQYLMSMKSHSWEELAFAEDARGPLGGFVWPPRSYSCSYCGREFRSAQALGGHMNVHRREKAKYKQTSVTITNPSRVSSTPTLGQESVDSSFDMKSCSGCDEGFVGVVETSLVLGFDLDSCSNTNTGTGNDIGGGGKRRKMHHVAPPIIGGLDLELRLATFHAC